MAHPGADTCSHGDCGVVKSDVLINIGELELFLRGRPTELQLSSDFTVCKCKIHRKTLGGVSGGEGCVGVAHGKLPSLAALYEGTGRTYCHATEATRANDQRFVAMALNLDFQSFAFAGKVDDCVQPLVGGVKTTLTDWGAGYCYMQRVLPTARWRVGRVLGAECLVVDLLRVLRLVGLSQGVECKLIRTSRGLHVVKDGSKKGSSVVAGRRFVVELMQAVVKYGDTLRVGMAGGLDAEWANWLAGHGVFADERSGSDLALVRLTAALMPSPLQKKRHKKLSMVGDRVMKLILSERTLDAGDIEVEDVQRLEAFGQSDASFADLAAKCGLLDFVGVVAGVNVRSARVGGSAFEALVGTLYVHFGMETVRSFTRRVGVVYS